MFAARLADKKWDGALLSQEWVGEPISLSRLKGSSFTVVYDPERKKLTINGLDASYSKATKTLTLSNALSAYVPETLTLFNSGRHLGALEMTLIEK